MSDETSPFGDGSSGPAAPTAGPSHPGGAGLRPRQRAFVHHMIITGNASEAARRAGYSEKSAADTGSRLVRHPAVAAALAVAQDSALKRLAVTEDRVLTEIARIAFADLTDYLTWGPDGTVLKSSAMLDDDQSAAVAEVAETTAGRVRLKLHDKVRALDALAKRLGLLADPAADAARHEDWLARLVAAMEARVADSRQGSLQAKSIKKTDS